MLVVCHTAGIYITPLYSTLACVETRARIKARKGPGDAEGKDQK
jgi:hypothetical protein